MTELDESTEPKSGAKRKTAGNPPAKSDSGQKVHAKKVTKKTAKKSVKKKAAAKSSPPPGTLMTEALGETFLVDLITDWQDHGGGVIENCRTTKPDAYLKLVATYAPKEFRKTLEPFEGMSDHDLKTRFHEALEEIRSLGLDLGARACP